VIGQMDEDVVPRVIGAVPGQLDAFTSDLEDTPVREGLLGRGPRGIVVTKQQPPRLLVADARDAPAEQRGRAGVIGARRGTRAR
jgi:hypothetical protein